MGILDFLSSEDAQLGLGLLGAAGPRSDGAGFGQRLQEGMGYVQAQKDAKQKRAFMDAQMSNYESEIEARKLATVKYAQQQENDARFMGLGGSGAPSSQASAQPMGGASAGGPASGQGGGFTAEGIAKQFGIPIEAVMSDYRFNGGKEISKLISERSKPNWQNVNGNLVNTNEQGFKGGLQAGMATSAGGQMMAWQPDGKGGLVAGAPAGALDAYRAYQGIGAGLGAAARVNLRDNPDGTKTPVSELSENPVLQGMIGARPAPPGYATEPQMKVTASGNMGADPAALQREIKTTQRELMNPMDESSRGMLRGYLADLQRQAGDPRVAAQPGSATGAPAYGMTNEQAAQAKANEARLVGTAGADVVRNTASQKEGKLYGQLTAGLDRAIGLLGQGPTASGAGSMVDSAVGFIGKSTKGADVASQLDTASGWLTSNVPRMEGPQSDKDVQQYRIMAAEVGDRTKPVSQRLAAAKELQGLQAKYAELNGGQANTGAGGNWDDKPKPAAPPLPPNPSAQTLTKGQSYKLPNGVEAEWDGMRFKGK